MGGRAAHRCDRPRCVQAVAVDRDRLHYTLEVGVPLERDRSEIGIIASFEVDGGDIVVLETAIDCHWMSFLRDLHDNLAVIETLAAISSRWMRLVPSFCTVDSCRA
jgi:hypothetical protein